MADCLPHCSLGSLQIHWEMRVFYSCGEFESLESTTWGTAKQNSATKRERDHAWGVQKLPRISIGQLTCRVCTETVLESLSWPCPRCHYVWQTHPCLFRCTHDQKAVKHQRCGVGGDAVMASRVSGSHKEKEERLWMTPKCRQCSVCVLQPALWRVGPLWWEEWKETARQKSTCVHCTSHRHQDSQHPHFHSCGSSALGWSSKKRSGHAD